MTETTNKVNYIESKKKGLFWPILFLVFIILLSVWAFTYNHIVNTYWFHFLWLDYDSRNQLQAKISENNDKIREINNKPEIQVYKLLETNKRAIDELAKRSEVSKYILHLKSLAGTRYWINFQWFTLANWAIATTAVIESSLQEKKISYEKTRDFIRNYRTDTGALLDLQFVNVIEWMDTIKFDSNFKIK